MSDLWDRLRRLERRIDRFSLVGDGTNVIASGSVREGYALNVLAVDGSGAKKQPRITDLFLFETVDVGGSGFGSENAAWTSFINSVVSIEYSLPAPGPTWPIGSGGTGTGFKFSNPNVIYVSGGGDFGPSDMQPLFTELHFDFSTPTQYGGDLNHLLIGSISPVSLAIEVKRYRGDVTMVTFSSSFGWTLISTTTVHATIAGGGTYSALDFAFMRPPLSRTPLLIDMFNLVITPTFF